MSNTPDQALEGFDQLSRFFAKEVCQKGTKPLREGTEIAVFLGDKGPVSLKKQSTDFVAIAEKPTRPDMTFRVPLKAIEMLANSSPADVGEVGVEILKLMASQDSNLQIRVQVHIGPFEMLRNGYFSVLPLGGPTVMKFLASKGVVGLGKIKDIISRLRSTNP